VRERTDPIAAAALSRWLDRLRNAYGGEVLAIDEAVAITWGHLMARRTLPVSDGLIAATARVHNLTLVTPVLT
jgi:predicted nucleic acid-binding protein